MQNLKYALWAVVLTLALSADSSALAQQLPEYEQKSFMALMGTYTEGSILGGNNWNPDGLSIPIIVLTDPDTPPGTHTISYTVNGSPGPSIVFTIGAKGVVVGGATVATLSKGADMPNVPIADEIPPTDGQTDYPPVGTVPPPIVDKYLFDLDYNPTTQTAPESAQLSVESDFEWDKWLYGPDSVFGYQDVYWSQARVPNTFTQAIYFHVYGALNQAPFCPFGNCGTPACASCQHMAVASFDSFQAGIRIADAPVGYNPAIGQNMQFQATYHQRLTGQPSAFIYSNLGPQWSFNWQAYISGGPTNNQSSATYLAPGGSQYIYGGYQATPGNSTQGDFQSNEGWNLATLHYRQSPQRYERWLPDGTVEAYAQAIGTSPNQLFFLTSITDPQGNVTTLSYDATAASRGYALLNAVTDPKGGQLLFGYNNADGLKITKVTRSTDGLSAKFEYANGQLTSSTDTIGITSAFTYTPGTNFINSMTTPYGTTTFSSTDGSGFLEADMTNPLGQKERVEYLEATSLFPSSEVSVPTATGLISDNTNLNHTNTFYWNRRAMSQAASNGIAVDSAAFYGLGVVTHWAESNLGSVPVPLSIKKPLEGRVWYKYPGQPSVDGVEVTATGSMVMPSVTARLVDGGATQATYATYNSLGMVTQSVDPLGRTTNYTYATNNQDLLSVKQVNTNSPGGLDTLSSMSNYTRHLPQTITDASGQVTSLTYNGQGQMLTRTVVVNSTNQTTTLAYFPSGYLQSATGPVTGAVTSYTYDADGRVLSVTDSEGYVIKTAYDNIDRPTLTTYPDGTTDQIFYKNLDVDHSIDRQLRVTSNTYDAIRELLTTTDPLGRTVKYSWCTCGGLSTLTDANGNVTTWNLDLQGRVTGKVYADSSQITYTYENNLSRLHAMTDANGNGATYAYNIDNTLAGTAYTSGPASSSTPNVSFTYDTPYNRVLTMVDGTGKTIYAYNQITGVPTLGAGRLSSVTVPILGTSKTATVTYTYDELGRVVTRGIDKATTNANHVATTFDTLGRVTNVSNALGSFLYAYVDTTSRLSSVTYPIGTGLSSSYSYYPSTDHQNFERLQAIQNLKGTTQLSDFQYTYNPMGTIAKWTQQSDNSPAVVNTLSYDGADQLIGDTQSGGATTVFGYNYDPAGNRLTGSIDNATTVGQFNNLNQLTETTMSATSTTVAGHTSAAVNSLNVNDAPATISGSTNFTANVPLPSGTNTFTVVARPANGSIVTQKYQVVTTGSAPTVLSYDRNGNFLTDENGNKFQWDALNRLTKITYPNTAFSTFAYDGLNHRVQIAEYNSSHSFTSTKNYLWIGQEIAEERDTNNNVTKRFFPQGEQQAGTNYYYSRDHLGSVRELLNSSGTIVARYSYDPYGRIALLSGSNLATKHYAGYYAHQTSGLYLTKYRVYDCSTGRWSSEDPEGEDGGINLYEYAGNDAVCNYDPLGLVLHAVTDKDIETEMLSICKRCSGVNSYHKPISGMTWDEYADFMANQTDTMYHYGSNRSDTYTYSGTEFPELLGKTFTGHELNYIGVGGGMACRGWSQGFSHTIDTIWDERNGEGYPSDNTFSATDAGYNFIKNGGCNKLKGTCSDPLIFSRRSDAAPPAAALQ